MRQFAMRCLPMIPLLVGSVPAAQAALITAAPSGGTTTVFTTTGGASTFGPLVQDGFTFTASAQFSYGDVEFGLDANGKWARNAPFSWIAAYPSASSVTIDLGGSFSAVGLFMNYALSSLNGQPIGANPIITALDSTMTVLETYDLFTSAPISTPSATDAGAFRGIETGVNNIAFLQFGGSISIAHSITLASVAEDVPEPVTLAVFGLGLASVGLVRRKRR